jgi:hypothetical protein
MTLIVNEESHARDAHLGWSGFAAGGIRVYKAVGDHESYIREHVHALGKQFRTILIGAEQESSELRKAS